MQQSESVEAGLAARSRKLHTKPSFVKAPTPLGFYPFFERLLIQVATLRACMASKSMQAQECTRAQEGARIGGTYHRAADVQRQRGLG